MPYEPVVGDRFVFTWEQLGKPTVRTDVKVDGFGIVVLDDADVHYALENPSDAKFFVRRSRALGTDHYVVVSRVHRA